MDVFKNTINEYNYNILKENNLIDILSNATLTKGFCDLLLDDYIMMLRESKITSISIDEIEDSNDIKLNKINDIIPEHSIVLIYKNDYLFDDDILSDILTKIKELNNNNNLNILYNLFDDININKLKVISINVTFKK